MSELQNAYLDALVYDDDILTQFVEEKDLRRRIQHSSTFSDLVENLALDENRFPLAMVSRPILGAAALLVLRHPKADSFGWLLRFAIVLIEVNEDTRDGSTPQRIFDGYAAHAAKG